MYYLLLSQSNYGYYTNVTLCYVLHALPVLLLPSENVHLSIILISSQKYLAFPINIGQVTAFPLVGTAVNHIHNTLSTCANLGSFNVSCLKNPSHFHLMAYTVVNGPSISLYCRLLMIQHGTQQ